MHLSNTDPSDRKVVNKGNLVIRRTPYATTEFDVIGAFLNAKRDHLPPVICELPDGYKKDGCFVASPVLLTSSSEGNGVSGNCAVNIAEPLNIPGCTAG